MDEKHLLNALAYIYRSGCQDGLEYAQAILQDTNISKDFFDRMGKSRVEETLKNFPIKVDKV